MATGRERRFQAESAQVAQATASDVRSIARTADTTGIDAWWDGEGPAVRETVREGHALASGLAFQFLLEGAATAGFPELAPVLAVLDAGQLATALLVTGPVAFKTNMARSGDPDRARRVMADRLAMSSQRLALQGGRDTVALTQAANPEAMTGWRRELRGTKNCPFCRMLAGRGAVYRSEASGGSVVGRARSGALRGSRPRGAQYHDGCDCAVVPIWGTPAERRAAVADDPTTEFGLAAAPLSGGAPSAGNLRLVRPGKSGWHNIVDENGNIVEKVNGKAKAEARLAQLQGGQAPPGPALAPAPSPAVPGAAGHTMSHKGGGQWEIRDASGAKVDQVKGKAAAEARLAELGGQAQPGAALASSGLHLVKPGKSGWHNIVDDQGNVVEKVNGKAKAEARLAALQGGSGTGPPAAQPGRRSPTDPPDTGDRPSRDIGSVPVDRQFVESWERELAALDKEGMGTGLKVTTGQIETTDAEWRESLTDEERVALRGYYGVSYNSINQGLLGAGGDVEAITSPYLRPMIDDIRSALAKHPQRSVPVTTYRGVSPAPLGGYRPVEIAATYQPGDVIRSESFWSTSLQSMASETLYANRRHNPDSLLIEIENVYTGANGIGLSAFGQAESEVLLDVGAFFRVTSFDPDTRVLRLEQVYGVTEAEVTARTV